MATYILIHGAWHGAWAWQDFTPLLEATGHTVYAPDLPGHGLSATPPGDITMAHYLECIQNILSLCDEKAILVGHSMAGLIISQLAEEYPDKIEKLIFIAGFCPENNESLISISEKFPVDTKSMELDINFDQKLIHIANKNIEEIFYPDCTKATQTFAIKSLQAQPMVPMITAVKLGETFKATPKEYIICKNDTAIHPETQRWMAERNHCLIKEIDSHHSPFFSKPEMLADLIL